MRDYALYIMFFPQLMAGPITRASEFFPQLETAREFARDVSSRRALGRCLLGFFKKACLADNLALFVDPYFAAPAGHGFSTALLASLLFLAQIYCDFSGYCDLAIGTAALLGYRLPENFNFPYLSGSLTGFSRYWHSTLASWFRDYVYIPLVLKNRESRPRAFASLLLTNSLSGLWHGAAWPKVFWGVTSGFGVHFEERLLRKSPAVAWTWFGGVFIGMAALFRSESMAGALITLRALYLPFVPPRTPPSNLVTAPPILFGLVALLLVAHVAAKNDGTRETINRVARATPMLVWYPVIGAAFALAFAAANARHVTFIYFQF